jgi:hypothetical protein
MTGSEWDHVGIVVPGANPTGLHLLEATGEGVSAFPLVSTLLVLLFCDCSHHLCAFVLLQTSRLMAYSAFHIKYVALRKLRTPLLTATARWELLHRFAAEVRVEICIVFVYLQSPPCRTHHLTQHRELGRRQTVRSDCEQTAALSWRTYTFHDGLLLLGIGAYL